MPNYNSRDIISALYAIGLKKGDIVFGHSNIGFFGIPEEGKTVEIAFKTILNSFFEVIGKEGTLIVPTFTYSFPKNKIFNPDETPSECGIFTEMFRKRPDAFRSEDPCISIAAIGNKAEELTKNISNNSYGIGSFFERFYKGNGVICNMNFDAGSTFVHYVEREMKVPYRFDKTFTGVYEKNGHKERRSCTIWVRYISSDDTIASFDYFNKLACEKYIYKKERVGRGFIGAITAKDTFKLIKETLPLKPWFLTRAEVTGIKPLIIPE